eukprot:348262-Hanusia_phi.AAC.1
MRSRALGCRHVPSCASVQVKDKLRSLGFRWDSSRGVWTRPAVDAMSLLGVTEEEEISLEKLLAVDPLSQHASEAAKPSVEIVNGEVMVVNSYSVKDELKTLEFHFDR